MPRAIAAILLIALLAIGGGLIATTAYQAGLATAVTTAVAEGGTAVAPVVPAYGYGYGWGGPGGFGFGFFGFLGTLLFLFLIFGVIRALFWGGRAGGWGGRGWGGPGGPGNPGYDRWQGRAREVFDDFHRQAHDSETKPPPSA